MDDAGLNNCVGEHGCDRIREAFVAGPILNLGNLSQNIAISTSYLVNRYKMWYQRSNRGSDNAFCLPAARLTDGKRLRSSEHGHRQQTGSHVAEVGQQERELARHRLKCLRSSGDGKWRVGVCNTHLGALESSVSTDEGPKTGGSEQNGRERFLYIRRVEGNLNSNPCAIDNGIDHRQSPILLCLFLIFRSAASDRLPHCVILLWFCLGEVRSEKGRTLCCCFLHLRGRPGRFGSNHAG